MFKIFLLTAFNSLNSLMLIEAHNFLQLKKNLLVDYRKETLNFTTFIRNSEGGIEIITDTRSKTCHNS